MAWSSFAHLPTTEDEYWYILSHIKNGMSVAEVDSIIAFYKNKEKVQHHYRSNLIRLGVFKTDKNNITLNYDIKTLIKDRELVKDILKKTLIKNDSNEINDVIQSIIVTKSYELYAIIDDLKNKYPLIKRSNFVRWIRPIVVLLKIVDILSLKNEKISQDAKFLQEAYLKVANKFNQSVPLELVESALKKIDETFNITTVLDNILEIFNFRFKIELLMLPSWATRNKSYKIGQDSYTHIKIKVDLLKEDENEKKHITE